MLVIVDMSTTDIFYEVCKFSQVNINKLMMTSADLVKKKVLIFKAQHKCLVFLP